MCQVDSSDQYMAMDVDGKVPFSTLTLSVMRQEVAHSDCFNPTSAIRLKRSSLEHLGRTGLSSSNLKKADRLNKHRKSGTRYKQ